MTTAAEARTLHEGWRVYRTQPDAIAQPEQGSFANHEALAAQVPGSLFSALHGQAIALENAEDFDWWYCCDFTVDNIDAFAFAWLRFECLATLAEVWLNGSRVLDSRNMFVPVAADVAGCLASANTLCIVFRSVNRFLQQKRPRPRWKTNLTNHQQLRWLRTSLLGRMPGWTPPTPALGPCGAISLERWGGYHVDNISIRTDLKAGNGVVDARIQVRGELDGLTLHVGEHALSLTVEDGADGVRVFFGRLDIENPISWWPHTHGEPYRYACTLSIPGEEKRIPAGYCGFRRLELDTANGGFRLRVNDQALFARGACWTHPDITSFVTDTDRLRELLTLARDAGLNMLRVGGTMTYQPDSFYTLCDELGILVWQDFMFANMDYPVDDGAFLQAVTAEASHHLQRLANHPCIAMYCGNSEIQQQAAMMGMAQPLWSNAWFDEQLPALCERLHGGVPYIPSTPYGGALPFHIGTGVTHFYGVGAYRKPLLASGLDSVRFTAETLGFSHVPEPNTVEAMFDGNQPSCHSPRWKAGVPRDAGAGWDFEDIRDHYFQERWQTDPVLLRSRDTGRYLAQSRIVTGELVKDVLGHWRSPNTPCAGALLWFYQDLVPGAGWGLLDSRGQPKAAYHYVSRACRPLAAFLLDQGLDGLNALVVNDSPVARQLQVEVTLLGCPDTVIDRAGCTIEVAAGDCWQGSVDALLGHFRDLTYSYQFGLPQHDVVALKVTPVDGDEVLAEDIYFVQSLQVAAQREASIQTAVEDKNGECILVLESDRFLQAVTVEVSKGRAEDQYFHLMPGVKRRVRLSLDDGAATTIKGYISALNLVSPERLRVERVVADAM